MSSGAKPYRWAAIAEQVAALLPIERLHPAVLKRLQAMPEDQRIAVALSGGADSVALLLLLWAHFPRRRERWTALHFDHRLRGRASTADARFCDRLCRGLGVPLVSGRWDDAPPSGRGVSEAQAREARRAFFNATLSRRRIVALCTGHHRDDVAETLFMRLARGSGSAGLCAPRPVQVQSKSAREHLRPLLDIDKTEIVAALTAAGAPWREDESNATADYLRNRVRESVIPTWRRAADAGRDALAGLALSRELLEEDEVALDIWAERVARIDPDGGLDLAELRGQPEVPRAVARRVLHRWLGAISARTDLSRDGFNALLDFALTGRPGARFSLGAAHFARLRRGWLRCESASEARMVRPR